MEKEQEVKSILKILSDMNLLSRQLIYAISAVYDINAMKIVKQEEYSYWQPANKPKIGTGEDKWER